MNLFYVIVLPGSILRYLVSLGKIHVFCRRGLSLGIDSVLNTQTDSSLAKNVYFHRVVGIKKYQFSEINLKSKQHLKLMLLEFKNRGTVAKNRTVTNNTVYRFCSVLLKRQSIPYKAYFFPLYLFYPRIHSCKCPS